MTPVITSMATAEGTPWHFGSFGPEGRFGSAWPNGEANLSWWIDRGEQGQELCRCVVKCGSYRKAVRKLRQFLNGYNVHLYKA